jgi:PKD repeat protein
MVKNYKQTKCLSLLKGFLVLCACWAGSLGAQLNGTYTLNNAVATGGANFANWSDFATALNASGVSGAVTLNVQSSLTLTSTLTLNAITGSSSNNRVVINGGGNFVGFAGTSVSPEVIRFNGADFVTINNLVIRNTGTVVNVMGIRFTNNSDFNAVRSCTIEFSALSLTGATSGGAYIAFSSATSLMNMSGSMVNGNGSFNTINGNTFRTTNLNSPGPFCGIFECQSTSNYTTTAYNNNFTGNIIQNFYTYGINSTYTNGTVIARNDISRSNVTAGLPASYTYPIYDFYINSANRSVRIDSNLVHDLPFLNATPAASHTGSWNIHLSFVVGTTTLPSSVRGNYVYNIFTNAGGNLGIFGQVNNFCNITENRIENLRGNSISTSLNAGALQGIYMLQGNDIDVTKNSITRLRNLRVIYGIYLNSQTATTERLIADNLIKDVQSTETAFTFYNTFGIYANGGRWSVTRNTVDDMVQTGPYGSLYPLYAVVSGSEHNWTSNVVTHCIGAYYTYSFYSSCNSGTLNFRQNTINLPYATSPYGWSYYQYFHYGFGAGFTNFEGNLLSTNTSYYWGHYYGTNTNNIRYRNNHLWAPSSVWGANFYSPLSGTVTTYAAWKNSAFGGQQGDVNRNPRFMNISTRDFRSQDFQTQNNFPTLAGNPRDISAKDRNRIMSDRGAAENFFDVQAVSTDFTVPSTVCAGWSKNARLVVKNLFLSDTAYNYNVAFSINGGPKTLTRVLKRKLTNDTASVLFTSPIQLNVPGSNRIAIFIDIPDDNSANDSFIFNTNVLPAPGGGVFTASKTSTSALYQSSKPNDVTQVKVPVYYTVNSPRKYSNNTYWNGSGSSSGKEWTASTYAISKTGRLLSGTTTISKHATSTNDLEVKFETSEVALEDSFVTFFTKITDLGNGCDTLLKRDIFIYPTIAPDFSFPTKNCDGDLVAFIQKSKVKSGSMEFFWNFNTGNPADTSAASEPVFQFPKDGTYKVIMTAKTLPYGFSVSDTATLVVNPNPSVKFAKLNACEGSDLIFTNQTTPLTGVNSTWTFGDGKSKLDNSATVKYKYLKAGAYNVTLTANLNGCIASVSQRVFQLPTPKADFLLTSGSCNNDKFIFNNTSKISSGSFGSRWSFEGGTVSTEDDAVNVFQSSGTKTVVLSATSEFGCKDTIAKKINVLESPQVSFVNSPTCSRTPASFTNTTPVVGGASGAVKNYIWEFGDGKTSAVENPQYQYTTLGPKNITFTVELMNGCKSSFKKEIRVGVQAKAAFTATDVCVGQPTTFVNNTTWPQGKISYLWNFGDGTTSTSTNPVHTYSKAFSPNVTLYANIEGGCTDSMVINTLDIFEGPRTCDFELKTDYAHGFYGISVNPLNAANGVLGGQDKVDYTWIFEKGGSLKTFGLNAEAKHNFQDDGVYSVNMRAKSQSGANCECSKTKQIFMNRAGLSGLENLGIQLYPNPNNGHFNLIIDKSYGNDVVVELTGISGNLVKRIQGANSGKLSVVSENLADGAYFVRVISGNKTAVIKMMVSK